MNVVRKSTSSGLRLVAALLIVAFVVGPAFAGFLLFCAAGMLLSLAFAWLVDWHRR